MRDEICGTSTWLLPDEKKAPGLQPGAFNIASIPPALLVPNGGRRRNSEFCFVSVQDLYFSSRERNPFGILEGMARHIGVPMMSLKACHWVNPYTRYRFGRLEFVCGHYRCC